MNENTPDQINSNRPTWKVDEVDASKKYEDEEVVTDEMIHKLRRMLESQYTEAIKLPKSWDGKPSPKRKKNLTSKKDGVIEWVESEYPETCEAFKSIMEEQYLLFCKKQADYGPDNVSCGLSLETQEEKHISLMGITFKLNDKARRLFNLIIKKKSNTTENESVKDSFQDTANYGIMAQIIQQGAWGK
tara:strand:+ start:2903 stop:3466 length:564 start_codon:yes stop_codon:yes gene_type:complete